MAQRKIVTISKVVTGINTFNVQFANINFVPDEVIVKSVLTNSPVSTNAFNVYSDLVGDILFVAGASNGVSISNPNTSFIPRGSNGTWTFSLRDDNQAQQYVVLNDLEIYFQLEFVKYNN